MFLYWIHHKNHTNPKNEGYIGVTDRSLENRLKEHKKGANHHLNNAFIKYGDDIIVDELLSSDDNMCLFLEEEYRPIDNIGWNITKGGGMPPSSKGLKRSEETRKKLSDNKKGKYFGGGFKKGHKHSKESIEKIKQSRSKQIITEEQKMKISNALKGRKKPPRSPEHSRKQAESSAKTRLGKKRGPYKKKDSQ